MSEALSLPSEELPPIPATDLSPEQRVQLVGQAIEMAILNSIQASGFGLGEDHHRSPRIYLGAQFGSPVEGGGYKVWISVSAVLREEEISAAEDGSRRVTAAVALQRFLEERAAVLWREAGYQPDSQGTVHLQQEEVPA